MPENHPSTPLPTGDAASPQRPLRLGLLVDSLQQPRWVGWTLRRIVEQGLAAPALVVINGAPAVPPPARLPQRVRRRMRHAAYALYTRLDRSLFPVADDPLAREDISHLLEGVPRITVTPRQTAFSDHLEEHDLAAVRAADLDVALRLGFRILRGPVLSIPRLGVWSYHHGDNTVNRGGPPALWEVLLGEATTGAVLQVLGESLDDGRVLARTWVHTQPWSANRNRAHLYWHAAPMLERALRDAREQTPADGATASLTAYSRQLFVAPGNREVLRGTMRLAGRALRHATRKYLGGEQWCLAYRRAPNGGTPDLSPYRFRFLIPPADRFWADPFPVHHAGRDWIFFEDYPYAADRGRISVLEIGPDGMVGEPRPVLEPAYHLSYPFVFNHDGEWYLMPEARANKRVEVYRATAFPFEWTLDRTMLEGVDVIDPTLARIDGRWWLFANVAEEHRSSWIELHVWYGDSPFGPWTPHRRNPVVADVRRARPAGQLFRHEGVWYRPSQDCSSGYGTAINIQRVDRLDPDEYSETPVTRIDPAWRPGLLGVHTINASATLTVIDVNRRRWRWQR